MSDMPNKEQELDNENSTEAPIDIQKNDDTAAQSEKASSTIFVKHVYNTKKPAKNGSTKRILICITALIVCIAIGGCVFLADILIPKEDDKGDNSSALVEEQKYTVLQVNDFVKDSIVTIDGKDVTVNTNISKVSFSNQFGEFSIIPFFAKAGENTSASSESSSQEGNSYLYDTFWCIDGIDKNLTDSELLATAVKKTMTIKALNKMENTFSSVEEYHEYYGLLKPTRSAVITFNDGTADLKIYVGSILAQGDRYYFTTSKEDTVYVVNSNYADNYNCIDRDFANNSIINPIVKTDNNAKYFNQNEDLAKYDTIKVYGSVFGDEVYEFGMNDGETADYMPYKMTAPYKRPANYSFINSILNFARNGLKANYTFAYDMDEVNLEIGGITKPKCVVEVKIGDYNYKLIIGGVLGDKTESLVTMVDGKRQVFGINPTDIQFLIDAADDITKMYNATLITEDIYTVKSVEISASGKTHLFNLKHTERADNEGVYDTVVTYNGMTMDTQSFKLIYQRVLMLSMIEFVSEAPTKEPILTVKFNYLSGNPSRIVDFTVSDSDSYRCIAWVDGTPLGEVLKSSVDDVISCLKIYLDGGTVPDTWK